MEITESLFPGAEVHPLGKMMHFLQGLSEALPSGHVSTGLPQNWTWGWRRGWRVHPGRVGL